MVSRVLRLVLSVLALACLLVTPHDVAGRGQDKRVVRVAFFPMRGFHHYDREGKFAGYDVDYLDNLASLADWDVRHVPVHDWEEAMVAVQDGRADLLGYTHMTLERTQLYTYSALPAGRTRGVVLATANNDLVYEDFASFNGLRMGCVSTWVWRDAFMTYMTNNKFQPELVFYATSAEMRQSLHAGEIDAMVTTIMDITPDEHVLGEFAPVPFYYVTAKTNTTLMEELNEAMARIKLAEPDFEDRLMARWYPQSQRYPFSRKERDFVQSRGQITVSLFHNRTPFSQLNEQTGMFEGIVVDVLKLISRESGLGFVLSPYQFPTLTPVEALQQGKILAIAGIVRYEEQIRDRRLRMSDAFYSSSVVLVGRKGEPFHAGLPLRIAVPPGFRAVQDYLKKEYPHFRQVYFTSLENSLDAVLTGQVDGFMQNGHLLMPHLQGPRYAGLAVVPEVSFDEPLSIALPADIDPLLMSVLNKSIRRLDEKVIRQIVIDHTFSKPYVMSLEDILLYYRKPILIISVLSVLCISLLVYSIRAHRQYVRTITESEESLKNITNNINGGVITLSTSEGFPIIYANKGFLEILGYGPEEYDDGRSAHCMAYFHHDDVPVFLEAMRKESSGQPVVADLRMRHKRGGYVPVLLRGTLRHDKHGMELLYCVIVDISEQKAMIHALEVEKERYSVLVDQSTELLFEYDADGDFLSCSPKFEEAFAGRNTPRKPFNLPVHPDDRALFSGMLSEVRQNRHRVANRLRLQHGEGAYTWGRLVLSPVSKDEVLQRVVGRIENIHAEVIEHQRLESLARRDTLCDLFNREAFRTAVEDHLNASGTRHEGALFFIDIDNFKNVNDLLGHQIGDVVLKGVGRCLKGLFRESDPIGRYGGDEFCVYAPEMSTSRVLERASAINTLLYREYRGDTGESVTVSASVGVARCPLDGTSYDELMDKADKALYKAKTEGKNQTVFYSFVNKNPEAEAQRNAE